MSLLGSIYATGVHARNALYDHGVLKGMQLQGPVISIGNLTVGGSGKTPFTILLGMLLKAKGIKFDVLSRGYKRESRGTLLVDPEGAPQQFGDEPILIARKLQVPVIVGESRYVAGIFAERKFGPQLHILDDAFQHRSLVRDFDIVLLAPGDENDTFLPGGRLREPFSSLRRADAVVTFTDPIPQILHSINKPLWRIKRGVLVDKIFSAVAFCGIARPQAFLSQLRVAGVPIAGQVSFRDHHRYTDRDIEVLRKLKEQHRASGFITTEKDLINLGEYRHKLEPITTAKVTMELEDSANAVDTMLRLVSTRRPGHEKILLSS